VWEKKEEKIKFFNTNKKNKLRNYIERLLYMAENFEQWFNDKYGKNQSYGRGVALEAWNYILSKQSTPFIKCDDCDEIAEYHYCADCMSNHRD